MANSEHLEKFKEGFDQWNRWRKENPEIQPDLSDADFESDLHEYQLMYDLPEFSNYDLSNANLNRITARNSSFSNCNFHGSSLNFSDLCFSFFYDCNFRDAELSVTRIGSAEFIRCDFSYATLFPFSTNETKHIV